MKSQGILISVPESSTVCELRVRKTSFLLAQPVVFLSLIASDSLHHNPVLHAACGGKAEEEVYYLALIRKALERRQCPALKPYGLVLER